MLMYIGGMQMTPRARYAPSRTDDPPGTTRTPSAVDTRFSGSVSLSTNGQRPWSIDTSASAPHRNPSRIPCFTQAFTRQPVGLAGIRLRRAHAARGQLGAELLEHGAGVGGARVAALRKQVGDFLL